MERVAALNIVGKIRQHFAAHRWTTAQDNAWLDLLEHCDEGRAGTATMRYLGSGTEQPSPAGWQAFYRNVDTGPVQRDHCATCGGDGFSKRHRDDCPEPMHEDCGWTCPVGPCHCRNGAQRRELFTRHFPKKPTQIDINRQRPDPQRIAAILAHAIIPKHERDAG